MQHFKSLFFAAPLALHRYSGPTLDSALIANRSLLSTMSSSETQTAIFASGCFWGTDQIFRKHLTGITASEVGYIGGNKDNPSYREVCSGNTGHAEACKFDYDPAVISYAELVEFFYRTHDPTTLNRQGGDRGTQYRSAIFTTTPEQVVIAKKVTDEVKAKHYPNAKIETVIQEAGKWYTAEDYHQKYLDVNPNGYECANHRLWW